MTRQEHTDGTAALGCALTLTGMSCVLVTGAVCATIASAEPREHSELELAAGYEEQTHSLTHAEDGCYIYDTTLDCIPMPALMADRAVFVWTGCEVKTEAQRSGLTAEEHAAGMAAATGALGERGQVQLKRNHAEAMALAGLDFEDEGDRVRWGVRLWEGHGWYPMWSCGR